MVAYLTKPFWSVWDWRAWKACNTNNMNSWWTHRQHWDTRFIHYQLSKAGVYIFNLIGLLGLKPVQMQIKSDKRWGVHEPAGVNIPPLCARTKPIPHLTKANSRKIKCILLKGRLVCRAFSRFLSFSPSQQEAKGERENEAADVTCCAPTLCFLMYCYAAPKKKKKSSSLPLKRSLELA